MTEDIENFDSLLVKLFIYSSSSLLNPLSLLGIDDPSTAYSSALDDSS
jgi:hypothetical protein